MQTAFRSEEMFTQNQFARWVEELPAADNNRYELLGGRIVMTPPAGFPHGVLEVRLAGALQRHVDAGRLGLVFGSSAGFEFPSGDTIEPDVSFVSRERLHAGPKPVRGRFLRIVPDLVVEVISQSTARRDRVEKLAIYAQNGVREYWIVDEAKRQVAVHRLDARIETAATVGTEGLLSSRLLPGLEIRIHDLFANLD